MAPLTIGTAAMMPTRMYSSSRLGPPGTNRALLNTAWMSSGLTMPIVEVSTIRAITTATRPRYGRNSGITRRAVSRPTRPRGSAVVMPSTIAPSRQPAPPLKSQVNAVRQLLLTAISLAAKFSAPMSAGPVGQQRGISDDENNSRALVQNRRRPGAGDFHGARDVGDGPGADQITASERELDLQVEETRGLRDLLRHRKDQLHRSSGASLDPLEGSAAQVAHA